MKVATATIERRDSRASPQTPCPEVQPAPQTEPKPTRSPPASSTGAVASKVIGGQRPGDEQPGRRRGDEAQDEGEASRRALLEVGRQDPHRDAADPGDAAEERHQQHRGEPDEGAAGQRGDGGEGRGEHPGQRSGQVERPTRR